MSSERSFFIFYYTINLCLWAVLKPNQMFYCFLCNILAHVKAFPPHELVNVSFALFPLVMDALLLMVDVTEIVCMIAKWRGGG
jgi:hypothetical protein